MSLSINGSNIGYGGINTNSKQYKAAAKDFLAGHRLKGTWTLGQPFNSSILRNLSREDIDNSLVKSGNQLLLPRTSIDYTV